MRTLRVKMVRVASVTGWNMAELLDLTAGELEEWLDAANEVSRSAAG